MRCVHESEGDVVMKLFIHRPRTWSKHVKHGEHWPEKSEDWPLTISLLKSWFAFMVLHGFVEFTWPISLPKILVSVSLQGWSTRSQGVAATDPSGESMTMSVTCLGMSRDGQPFPLGSIGAVSCLFLMVFFLVHSESWDDPRLTNYCVRWC